MNTYEKKYKEALERAKKLYEQGTITESLSFVFPELAESEDERIRIGLINGFKECLKNSQYPKNAQKYWHNIKIEDILAWLEKQGEQPSVIIWYDASLRPQEMEELLVEWDSEDATWHEIAFYHADTKTFWDGERQVENVTRWCYIDDIIEQSPKPKWSEEDEHHWMMCLGCVEECATQEREDFSKTTDWLKSLKQRMGV